MCILLAEDEFFIREVAQEFLEEAGFEVLAAEDGQEAIDLLDHHPGRFTCLVTDYHMPRAHGGHVIEHFRADYMETPVILASAHPHATTPEWREHHLVTLVLKPYAIEELVTLIGKLIHAG